MAVLGSSTSGHIQNQLTRSLERILEEANLSGELKLSNRKLKDFPKTSEKYNLSDTVLADLSKNRFCELPEEVLSFHYLERLHCYHNAIRSVPDAIAGLQCLSFLDLSRNQLNTLPREICLLPIKILLVSNNNLTRLPDELHKMSELTELDASCNRLTHFPPRMGELRSLQSLVLRSNLLQAVPLELTCLRLVRLDLRSNRIGKLPLETRDMAGLIELLVEDNPLTCPPASLCKRGRVHICKYLELEAIRLGKDVSAASGGTLSRRSRRNGSSASPGPPQLTDRLKNKRQNVDSGYSTSSDGYDKRWSQEINVKAGEQNGTTSTTSTPSTISPAPEANLDEDYSKANSFNSTETDSFRNRDYISVHVSPISDTNGLDDKKQPLQQIQTYREYKEALKQQRAQDVPSIYRTKDDQSYKTEPNTPTHHLSPSQTLATSRSDPTPLNSAFGVAPKTVVFDDAAMKKPVQKVTPYPNGSLNGEKKDYVKPKSPMKASSGIMGHDNVPMANGRRSASPRAGSGGFVKTRSVMWNNDVNGEKISFTMRREIDKAREESDLINQLRNIIETRLKMELPDNLAPALTDGVVLCHLANHIRPRSVASIHVPSPAVPKLTMARCRRNVDNFLEACRKIGVDENLVCCAADVLEGKGLVQVAITVTELLRFHLPKSPMHSVV